MTNPVALITGSALRIGAAIAKTLASRGYDLILHYRNSEQAAQSLASTLANEFAVNVVLLQADIDASIGAKLSDLRTSIERLELLVNNASSFYPTPIGEATEQQWDDLFNSNAKGPFFLSQECAEYLKKNNGHIINIADIWGVFPKEQHTIYSMAKAANIMLTKSLALELAPTVRVNGIAPGAILPPSVDGVVIEDPDTAAKVPLQRMGGEDVIVQALCSLLDNDYINGEIIKVDGGRTVQLAQ